MMIDQIEFTEKTASEQDILSHLSVCDGNFVPPLSQRVIIAEYSKKIFEKSVTFEAWSNDLMVGLVAVYLNNLTECIGYITNVSLKKNFMGRGIATKLMEMCTKKAEMLGIRIIMLEVASSNIHAINFYKKIGFESFQVNGDNVLMRIDMKKESDYE
jgi:ribosomal-protein-alanine N-acetyltransferase